MNLPLVKTTFTGWWIELQGNEDMLNLYVWLVTEMMTLRRNTIHEKAGTHPVVKQQLLTILSSWAKFGQRILRRIFFPFCMIWGNERKHFSCRAEAFSSKLKKILKEMDSKCSMRPKPAYPAENTSRNPDSSEETVNIKAAEKDLLLGTNYGPAAGLGIKPGFLCLSLNPRGIKGQT